MFKYKNLLIIILSIILLSCSNNVVERHQEVIKYESQNDEDKYNKTDMIGPYNTHSIVHAQNRLFINYVKNNYKVGDKIKLKLNKNDVTTEYDCKIKEFRFNDNLQPEYLFISYNYTGNEPTIDDYLKSKADFVDNGAITVLDVDETMNSMPNITINNNALDIKNDAFKQFIEWHKDTIVYDKKEIPLKRCVSDREMYYKEEESNSIKEGSSDFYYFTYITDKKGLFLINNNTIYDSIKRLFYHENVNERDNDIKDITEFINNDKYIRFIETLNDKILKD